MAVSNYFCFAGFAPEKPPASIGKKLVHHIFLASRENGPENLTSKADIMKLLRDSFAYAHSAALTTDGNAT